METIALPLDFNTPKRARQLVHIRLFAPVIADREHREDEPGREG